MDRAYGKENLSFKKRKVQTVTSEGVIVSYFVTPKGNIFCWPPMEYEGKSYVNANVTAKSLNDEELFGNTATFAGEKYKIVFPNGEVVLVSNTAPVNGENIWNKDFEVQDDTISVWYDTEKNELDSVTKGVSSGFVFE